jgi:hypothetical protein
LTKIVWDAMASRVYQTGIDRGVLYVGNSPGVPWNGITSVIENSSGGAVKPLYLDGEKFSNLASSEEYDANLSAYTYPDEFEICDGTASVRPGLLVTRQKRKSFGLSYRTRVGNALSSDLGYRIHIVYNATASPSVHTYKTIGDTVSANDFNWKLSALPPVTQGYKRTSHIILDSRYLTPEVLSAVEDILYGTDSTLSRLLSFAELVDLIDTNATLTVVDNGDGTFTITAPMSVLGMVSPSNFSVSGPTVNLIDSTHYSVSSP